MHLTDEMVQAGVEAALLKWDKIVDEKYSELTAEERLPEYIVDEVRAHQAWMLRAAMEVVVPMVVERCAGIVDDHLGPDSYAAAAIRADKGGDP